MILTRVGLSHRKGLHSGRKAARLSYCARGSLDVRCGRHPRFARQQNLRSRHAGLLSQSPSRRSGHPRHPLRPAPAGRSGPNASSCPVLSPTGCRAHGCFLHNPGYDVNDEILALGASTCFGCLTASRAYARSQASAASARRLRDMNEWGEGRGEVGCRKAPRARRRLLPSQTAPSSRAKPNPRPTIDQIGVSRVAKHQPRLLARPCRKVVVSGHSISVHRTQTLSSTQLYNIIYLTGKP